MGINLINLKEQYFKELLRQYDCPEQMEWDLQLLLERGTSKHPKWIAEYLEDFESWAYREWDWSNDK